MARQRCANAPCRRRHIDGSIYCAPCREAVNKVTSAESVFAARRGYASEGWRRYTYIRSREIEAWQAFRAGDMAKYHQLSEQATRVLHRQEELPPRPSRSLGPPVSIADWRSRRPASSE